MDNTSSLPNRRKFIATSSTAAGVLLATPLINKASGFVKIMDTYRVGEIIDMFIKEVPGGKLSSTVDTLKAGSRDMVVTGIITAMFATIDVIRKAVELGANFIIAHEPAFYNHVDDTSWLQNNDVYQYKADLLKQHNITVWRNHDYIHRLVPDGVTMGVLKQLDWIKYSDKVSIITLPEISLKDLIGHTKDKLNIEKVRFIGNLSQPCKKILLMLGAAGGQRQIESANKIKPDVLICGEISEWETAEYVRDARAKGDNLSLIVLGHIASEEAGSQFMLNWLKQHLPSIKATHVLPGNSLSFA